MADEKRPEDEMPPMAADLFDEELGEQSDMATARKPSEGFLPKFDPANPPVKTADIHPADSTPSQQPEQSGPSPQDLVRQMAWERRSQRRARMGMPPTPAPWQGGSEDFGQEGFEQQMNDVVGGGDNATQVLAEMSQLLEKAVELLKSIDEKIENIGGLA